LVVAREVVKRLLGKGKERENPGGIRLHVQRTAAQDQERASGGAVASLRCCGEAEDLPLFSFTQKSFHDLAHDRLIPPPSPTRHRRCTDFSGVLDTAATRL